MAHASYPERELRLHGDRIAYREAGRGPVLLLVHGVAGSSRTWEPVMPRLAHQFRVIAPDLLGHGGSSKPRADYSLGAHASGLRDLLDVLGHRRATVVGHSLGGGIAMQFAYQFPEHCERLVLISSGGLGREVTAVLRAASLPGAEWVVPLIANRRLLEAARSAGGWLRYLPVRPSLAMREVARAYASLADDQARATFIHTVRSVIDARGQRVSATTRLYLAAWMPILLIWGARDPIIPVQHAYAAHKLLPDSRLEILEHAGHFPHLDEPDHIAKVIIDFAMTTRPARLRRGATAEMMRGTA